MTAVVVAAAAVPVAAAMAAAAAAMESLLRRRVLWNRPYGPTRKENCAFVCVPHRQRHLTTKYYQRRYLEILAYTTITCLGNKMQRRHARRAR